MKEILKVLEKYFRQNEWKEVFQCNVWSLLTFLKINQNNEKLSVMVKILGSFWIKTKKLFVVFFASKGNRESTKSKIHLDTKQTEILSTITSHYGKNLKIVRVGNFLERTFPYRILRLDSIITWSSKHLFKNHFRCKMRLNEGDIFPNIEKQNWRIFLKVKK